MRIGFIGTGAIAHAIVIGLNADGADLHEIWVSPRNAETAAELARNHASVRVADSNQHVIDNADIVFVSVRPQVAADVLSRLRFRAGICVVSVVATYSADMVKALVSPADVVVRAIPLPSVARRLGPTAFHPPHPDVETLFSGLGPVFPLDSERALDVVSALTAGMASFFALLDAQQQWASVHGLEAATARKYIGAFVHALAAEAQADMERSFARLITEHTTPGGINEQLHAGIVRAGVLQSHRLALDGVLARIDNAQSESTEP